MATTESGYFKIVDREIIFETKRRYIEIRLVKDIGGRYYTRLYVKVKKMKEGSSSYNWKLEEKVDLARFPISPGMLIKIASFFERIIKKHGLLPHPTMAGEWVEPQIYYQNQEKYKDITIYVKVSREEL